MSDWKDRIEKQNGLIEKHRKAITAIVGENWTLTAEDSGVDWTEKLNLASYVLRLDKKVIASFKLYPMINCCGIAVSSLASVVPTWQHKGLGTVLNSMRIDIARYAGYGILLCTDDMANTYQRQILAHNGWKDIFQFINPRTTHRVAISVIQL